MTKPAKLKFTIYQGAPSIEKWQRLLCDYEVELRNGRLANKLTGAAVPDADLIPEDYTGCTARMQARSEVGSPYVLFELTTENGGIALAADGWVQIDPNVVDAARMKYGNDAKNGFWETAIGHIEVTRPDGRVDRQYEITFTLDPEVTLDHEVTP